MEVRPLREALIYLLYHRDPKWTDEIVADMILVLIKSHIQ